MSRVTVSSCPSESQQAYPFLGLQEDEYAVKVGDLQRVRIPPGQSVAPAARGTVVLAALWYTAQDGTS